MGHQEEPVKPRPTEVVLKPLKAVQKARRPQNGNGCGGPGNSVHRPQASHEHFKRPFVSSQQVDAAVVCRTRCE